MEPQGPPENADDWSDQQWIDWLKATDAPAVSADEPIPPTRVARIAHLAGGQVLGNAMIGLARALYGRQDERPAIVVESGESDTDRFDLHLDFDHPEQSTATVKPESRSPNPKPTRK